MATHPVFLPGKSHEQRSLMCPRDHKELDTTEQLGRWLLQMAELSNVTETIWPTRLKIFTIWPFTEKKFADSCSRKKRTQRLSIHLQYDPTEFYLCLKGQSASVIPGHSNICEQIWQKTSVSLIWWNVTYGPPPMVNFSLLFRLQP